MENSDLPLLFAGTSSVELTERIKDITGFLNGRIMRGRFSDGETRIRIEEDTLNKNTFIVQSTLPPVNDSLMELLITADAIKRGGASDITAVIPYFGYGRQDRKVKAGEPVTAELVAKMISSSPISRVITLDIHSSVILSYFRIPCTNIYADTLFADWFKQRGFSREDTSVVSPDLGAVTRSRKLAQKLHLPFSFIEKKRPDANISRIVDVRGDIKGRKCILTDDIVDTAGTLTASAERLMELGAKEVYAAVCHGILSGEAFERIYASPIKEVILLDTVPFNSERDNEVRKDRISKFKVLSSAGILSLAIEEIERKRSSGLLRQYR